MKLHMVSELSISFLVFYTPPSSGMVTVRVVRILLECILVTPVCHSVHGREGGVSVPACTTAHMICPFPWGSLSGGSVQGESLSGGLCPGGFCLGGVSVQMGSLCPEEVSVWENPPPSMATSGWYPSYWNVFLY